MKEKLYDIINRTSIELGHKTDGKTLAVLTKSFLYDLENENRLKRLSIDDVDMAFRLGVRLDTKDTFINIRTFWRWCLQHKQRLNDAYYEVHTLGADPKKVPYYKQNLLK